MNYSIQSKRHTKAIFLIEAITIVHFKITINNTKYGAPSPTKMHSHRNSIQFKNKYWFLTHAVRNFVILVNWNCALQTYRCMFKCGNFFVGNRYDLTALWFIWTETITALWLNWSIEIFECCNEIGVFLFIFCVGDELLCQTGPTDKSEKIEKVWRN